MIIKKTALLVQFEAPTNGLMLLKSLQVDIKEIHPTEAESILNEVANPFHILKERWDQGAKMVGAFWEKKLIYYTWIFKGNTFHDKINKFSLSLNPNEVYWFDSNFITTLCPTSFGSIKFIRALIGKILLKEENNGQSKPLYYALVSPDDYDSLNLYLNILYGRTVAMIQNYHFLGRQWSTRQSLIAH